MPEYPDNSHSGREAAGPPEKKVGKVVTGTAKTRKKSGAQKFAGAFLPEDVTSVKSYILRDVVVPGIKNAIADVVSIMLFGETGRIGGRKTNGSKVSYNRYYDDKRDDRREYGRPRAPGGFDYDDIVFETRGDAERVLDQLESVINIYGLASVLDLYDLSGITPPRGYASDKYGWTDIRSAKVARVRDGYILELPRAVQIS